MKAVKRFSRVGRGIFLAIALLLGTLSVFGNLAFANEDCSTPSQPFVFANPPLINDGELGVCSVEQPLVNGVEAQASARDQYNWAADGVTGTIMAETPDVSVTVEVHQLAPTTTLELASVSFTSGPYTMTVVEYPRQWNGFVYTDVVQVTGWQWDFDPTSTVTMKTWYAGKWNNNVPAWTDHMIFAFTGEVDDPECYTLLPKDNWVFASPVVENQGRTGVCVSETPYFNGMAGTLDDDLMAPFNWYTGQISGSLYVSTTQKSANVEIAQIGVQDVFTHGDLITVTSSDYPVSIVTYPVVTSTYAVTQVFQVTGWMWDFDHSADVIEYWDYASGQWSLTAPWVAGSEWPSYTLMRLVDKEEVVPPVYTTYLPVVKSHLPTPTVELTPMPHGNEVAQSLDLDETTNSVVALEFDVDGSFQWGTSIWVDSSSQVEVSLNGSAPIMLSWQSHVDTNGNTYIETGTPPAMNQIAVKSGDVLVLSIEKGSWMNLVYRYNPMGKGDKPE